MQKLNDKDINNKQVKQAVMELYELDNEFKEWNDIYSKRKKELKTFISNHMYTQKGLTNGFAFNTFGNKLLCVKKVVQKRIEWDISKLKEKVADETLELFVDKTYKVTNINSLIKLLKKYNVPPKQFKQFICVEESVNKNKLEQLFDIGEITMQELKDCYKVNETEGYIKIDLKDE